MHLSLRQSVQDGDVLTLDVAELTQSIAERLHPRQVRRQVKNANPINLARLLSLAGKRPGDEQEGDGSGDDRRPHAPVSKPIAHGHPRDLKPTVRIVMVVPPLCPTPRISLGPKAAG